MPHAIVRYLHAINLRDATDRLAALHQVVTEGVVYTHAHAPEVYRGRPHLASLLELFATHKSTTTWEPVGTTETHHHAFRQRYQTVIGGDVQTEGTYTGTTDDDGRLQLVLGFIDAERDCCHGRC